MPGLVGLVLAYCVWMRVIFYFTTPSTDLQVFAVLPGSYRWLASKVWTQDFEVSTNQMKDQLDTACDTSLSVCTSMFVCMHMFLCVCVRAFNPVCFGHFPSVCMSVSLCLLFHEHICVLVCVFALSLSLSYTASLAKWLRRPPRERKVPGSNPACDGIFSGSSHTSDLKIGTPVVTLPGAWRFRVSTGTGRPGVSILWLGEVERLICNFYLSVAARTIVWADPSLRYTSLLLGR